MNLLLTLLIGGFVGWLAAKVAGRDEGLVASMVIGVVGSIIGGFLAAIFNSSAFTGTLFYWPGLAWAFIGSVLLVALLNVVQRRGTRKGL